MRRILPRTIQGQLIFGTIVVQTVLLVIFLTYTISAQRSQTRERARQRLLQQVERLAGACSVPLSQNHMDALKEILETARITPTIDGARVTDLSGRTLAVSESNADEPLSAEERRELMGPVKARLFATAQGRTEGVAPIFVSGKPAGLIWLEPSSSALASNIGIIVTGALWYGGLALLSNLLPILLIVRGVSRPLRKLREATQQIIRDPESNAGFPLVVTASNEVGELTRSFNTMVRELEDQRAGLYETLALLDSMLGNAPIGFAFFDQKLRYVRLNQFLADINGLPINRHLGRRMTEVFPGPLAERVEMLLSTVFDSGEPVRDIEMKGELPSLPGVPRSWICNWYPVRTQQGVVRWVGVVVMEITQRLQAEEALRKTEKLAAAGRLAASIAHEINNPLEAVTNLLYLLQTHPELDSAAREYVSTAQAELARVSEITQQTLRFYRQSTFPVQTQVGEVLDSVLALHQLRLGSARITVEREYGPAVALFGFSGELRQLFANLIGNAIDAMVGGGRLIVRARYGTGRSLRGGWCEGVRVTVSDTGTGMSEETRRRLFEPFYTTKDATGTGLGLWVSDEIIRKHSGTVRVKSRQGEQSGTTFAIFFPKDGLNSVRPILSNDAAKEAANA
ncbi:sensor histidine kinase [Terriglobus albidus]|uniref:sensor histidine kinase n=1 Tax=Terriglobus albidus TaxID=1592106 RepID=UPI0021DFD5B8|nr:HAMP domain-containing sensor histidine kinase [Terriglobus albidus]